MRVLRPAAVVNLQVVDSPLAVRRRVQLFEAVRARAILTRAAALRGVHPEFQVSVQKWQRRELVMN